MKFVQDKSNCTVRSIDNSYLNSDWNYAKLNLHAIFRNDKVRNVKVYFSAGSIYQNILHLFFLPPEAIYRQISDTIVSCVYDKCFSFSI